MSEEARRDASFVECRLVFSDKEEAVWQAFDLCKVSEITLKYEGKRPTAIYK